jgi:uncharacterized protein YggU (UPF0235/DUF167 family)
MQITVKVRYGTSSSKFESFGNNRYLVYLLSQMNESDSDIELITLISRNMGVPPNRIKIVKGQGSTDKIIELG